VVDTSGHKHRECIVWTKSIITNKGKNSRPTSYFFWRCMSKLFHLVAMVTFLYCDLNQKVLFKLIPIGFQATVALKAKYITPLVEGFRVSCTNFLALWTRIPFMARSQHVRFSTSISLMWWSQQQEPKMQHL